MITMCSVHRLSTPTTVSQITKQMAGEGWDVWEIEMTGGSETDCSVSDTDTCPNYIYGDLTTYYWPALIAGIQKYSGKGQVDYVGHSNGCRAALSSLNSYSTSGKNNSGYYFDYNTGQYYFVNLSSNPVRKFVGVACPATLNDETMFTKSARKLKNGKYNGDLAIDQLNKSGKGHVTGRDYAKLTEPLLGRIFIHGETKISLNLLDFYNDMAIDQNTPTPGNNANISELHLIFGTRSPNPFIFGEQDDGTVHINDATNLLSTITASKENLTQLSEDHSSIKRSRQLIDYIKGVLK